MKWFKWFDIVAQVVLTLVAVLIWDENGFFVFYLGVGGWQVLSCIIHAIAIPRKSRSDSRRVYEITVVCVLLIGVLILYAMIFIGALMAIWYLATCISELATKDTVTTDIETI